MNNNFVFQFAIGKRSVFSKSGEYFFGRYVDTEQLAFGLFTSDPEGFLPVTDMHDYEMIQTLAQANTRFKRISIVGSDKGCFTVAVDFAGEYEYFRLTGIRIGEILDGLADSLATGVDSARQSSFTRPYVAEIKDGTIQSIK